LIPQREISQKAFRAGKQDRVIEKDYVITWLLLGLGGSPLSDLLAFKGGTALKKTYFPDYRYSEDMDFTVIGDTDDGTLLELIRLLLDRVQHETAITLEINERRTERRRTSLTLYLDFIGPLRGAIGSRNIKVDLTFGEQLVFPVQSRRILADYSDCRGLVKTIPTYSLEEILIEKICALMGRTEPRDLYDVNFLLGADALDREAIAEGFAAKAASKGLDPNDLAGVLKDREPTVARLWDTRLSLQVDLLPPFERVMRETRRSLRLLGLI
jgi:predicted nucleotidyltransferase component of viral defense system